MQRGIGPRERAVRVWVGLGVIVGAVVAACGHSPRGSRSSPAGSVPVVPTPQATKSVGPPDDLGSLFPSARAAGPRFVVHSSPFADLRPGDPLVSQAYSTPADEQVVGINIHFYPSAASAVNGAEKLLGAAPLPTTGRLGRIGAGGAMTPLRKVPAGVERSAVFAFGSLAVQIFAAGKATDQFPTGTLIAFAPVQAALLQSGGY